MSKAILLLCYLLYQSVYVLQFLRTASLVGQDQQEIIAMGVQLIYILSQDNIIMKNSMLFDVQGYTFILLYSLSKGVHSPTFCTQLA